MNFGRHDRPLSSKNGDIIADEIIIKMNGAKISYMGHKENFKLH